jgi:phage terminase small subunit
MAGRRPKPTSLKLLQGTARKSRERVNEPIPPEGKIVRPDFLKYREVELWDEYGPVLVAMGTLTVADVPNFAAWCVKMAQFELEKGNMKASDIAQMRMLAAGLGMDASARAKLGTPKSKKKEAGEKYFNAS